MASYEFYENAHLVPMSSVREIVTLVFDQVCLSSYELAD